MKSNICEDKCKIKLKFPHKIHTHYRFMLYLNIVSFSFLFSLRIDNHLFYSLSLSLSTLAGYIRPSLIKEENGIDLESCMLKSMRLTTKTTTTTKPYMIWLQKLKTIFMVTWIFFRFVRKLIQ